MIGCERCLRDLGCELDTRTDEEFQAFSYCTQHGLAPFSEHTEDCACHARSYRRVHNADVDFGALSTTNHVEFDGAATFDEAPKPAAAHWSA